jgi:hypothetical protein
LRQIKDVEYEAESMLDRVSQKEEVLNARNNMKNMMSKSYNNDDIINEVIPMLPSKNIHTKEESTNTCTIYNIPETKYIA